MAIAEEKPLKITFASSVFHQWRLAGIVHFPNLNAL
jgi:hypothetical protein